MLDEAVTNLDQLSSLLHRLIKAHHGFNVARFAEHFPMLDRSRELLRQIWARITASTQLPHRCDRKRITAAFWQKGLPSGV
ncbi:hypothetical protein V4C53_32335 [Paraburkholderia azotifigens]|uniref:hypothetical protein n=1 Tax=Paraburkholderia azotifigens TaxID=2057004 RepID=UPI00317F4E6E